MRAQITLAAIGLALAGAISAPALAAEDGAKLTQKTRAGTALKSPRHAQSSAANPVAVLLGDLIEVIRDTDISFEEEKKFNLGDFYK